MALRLGVALSATRAVATVRGSGTGTPVSEALRLPAAPESPEAELLRAFTQLSRKLEATGAGSTAGAVVRLALAASLAETRLVELPPLRHDELLEVLRRDVSRHFLGSSGARVVGVRRAPKVRSDTGSGRVLAAAASLAFLEAVQRAASEVGWSVDSVSAAHADWIEAASERARGNRATVLAVEGGAASVIKMDGAVVESVRQASARDRAQVLEALGSGAGSLLLLAPEPTRADWAAAVTAAGWVPDPYATPAASPGATGADALEVAAAKAGAGGLELLTPTLAAERAARTRRRAVGLGVAAGVLLFAAAGAHLWGIHRELDAVRQERLAIAAEVEPLLTSRDSLRSLVERVEAMRSNVESTPRWSGPLAELALLLPRDSYLTSLYTSGDTLEIEAAGSRAGEAIQELRASDSFRDVRLEGVVERELENGETVVERFTVSARLNEIVGGEGGTE